MDYSGFMMDYFIMVLINDPALRQLMGTSINSQFRHFDKPYSGPRSVNGFQNHAQVPRICGTKAARCSAGEKPYFFLI